MKEYMVDEIFLIDWKIELLWGVPREEVCNSMNKDTGFGALSENVICSMLIETSSLFPKYRIITIIGTYSFTIIFRLYIYIYALVATQVCKKDERG